MEVHPDRTQTTEKLVTMQVKEHKICWQESACLLAMVLERHGKNGNIGYGFLTGSCQREGTVATTFFHDHHNLFVAGNDPEDMLFAVQRIGELQGGFLTVKDGQILSELALPVCGILSEASIEATGSALKEVRESLIDLGYEHHNPIMSVGTLGLPVSPALKLTDHGLIDVKEEKSCLWCYPVLDFFTGFAIYYFIVHRRVICCIAYLGSFQKNGSRIHWKQKPDKMSG